MLSARFELAIFRVSGERIDQLSHESKLIQQPNVDLVEPDVDIL